jgi:hypothetical protein
VDWPALQDDLSGPETVRLAQREMGGREPSAEAMASVFTYFHMKLWQSHFQSSC